MAAVLFVVMLEPMEIYNYLSRNTRPYHPYAYTYDSTSLDFHYLRGDNDVEIVAGEGSLEDPFEVDSQRGS